jgi:hypothetical protein
MTRLLRAMILVVFVFGAKGAFAATTHYISKSAGSDANNGTSKTTPWAHMPGMPSCTGNCASYSPVAGDSFIFKGGDTWVASDLGINFFWSGNSTNCVLPYGSGAISSCIYIGVDQTWFTGGSWTRPVFTCGGTDCGSGAGKNFFYIGAKYVVLDNVEMKGLYDNTGGEIAFVYTDQDHVEAKNLYLHGWSHPAGATSQQAAAFDCANNSGGTCAGTLFHDSVIDGSDTSKDMMWGSYGGGIERIYNNYYAYGPGFVSNWNFFYNNTIEYCTYSFDGNHGNCVFNGAPLSGNNVYQFNNVIRHTTTTCPGCVKLWFMGQSQNSSYVGYGFNNVMYDNDPSNIIDFTPSSGSGSGYGTYYLFNNTIECGNDSNTTNCTYGATGGHPFTLHMQTNHWITNSSVCGPATCPNESNDLVETVAQATTNGYTSSQAVAFLPTASNSLTVGKGNNNQAWCATLTSLDTVAGAACQSDGPFGVGYNTTNHTVIVPGHSQTARPASGAWDIGAYQFTSGGSGGGGGGGGVGGAVSLVQQVEIGSVTQTGSNPVTPTATFPLPQTAGDANVVVIEYCGLPGWGAAPPNCLSTSSPGPITSVTDTAGNTYTRNCGPLTTISSGSYTNACGGGSPAQDGYNVTVEVWSALNIKSAPGVNVVTAHMPTVSNMNGWNVWLFQLHPASGSIVFDQYVSKQTGTSTNLISGPISTGTTATTNYPNEFAFAYCMTASGTCPGPLNVPTWIQAPLNGSVYYDTHSDAAYRITSSQQTLSESFTAGSGATEWLGLLVTYGVSGSQAQLPQPPTSLLATVQ